jgi:predicted NUDIX family phosphoesterase
MLEFNASNLEELEIEARERAYEVSAYVVAGVIKALENGVDKVIVGILKNVDLDLSVDKSKYLEVLETNLFRLEEAEEYELCKEAIIWIKKLRENPKQT